MKNTFNIEELRLRKSKNWGMRGNSTFSGKAGGADPNKIIGFFRFNGEIQVFAGLKMSAQHYGKLSTGNKRVFIHSAIRLTGDLSNLQKIRQQSTKIAMNGNHTAIHNRLKGLSEDLQNLLQVLNREDLERVSQTIKGTANFDINTGILSDVQFWGKAEEIVLEKSPEKERKEKNRVRKAKKTEGSSVSVKLPDEFIQQYTAGEETSRSFLDKLLEGLKV